MSAFFVITHDDGRVEHVDDLGEAILKLVEIYRNEECGGVDWSS